MTAEILEIENYQVRTAENGRVGIGKALAELPDLILCDIMMPELDGYDVYEALSQNRETASVPFIFLTAKSEKSDVRKGMTMGADDYVTKPFDIEELKLRVANAITAAKRQNQLDPKSGLPTGRLIEDHLRNLLRGSDNWSYIDIKIKNFEPFTEVYGFVAGDEVVRFMSPLISEVVEEQGTANDYVGHPGRDNFVIITHTDNAKRLQERLMERFDEGIQQHYSFIDRERGYILVPDSDSGEKQIGLMKLSIGAVSTKTHQFSDIREVTELAAEDRRRGGIDAGQSSQTQLPTSW